MNIYAVIKSTSYDIAGDTQYMSYHQSEEGAYLAMSKIAGEEGFTEDDVKTYDMLGIYIYSRNSTSLSVETIKVEE